MFTPSLLAFVLALPAAVLGHGAVTTPKPRALGTVAAESCGATVYAKLKSDLLGPIENSIKVIDSSYDEDACPLYFCRGYNYEDNASNTRVYEPGTSVNIKVDLAAHHTGYANVSIVDTASRSVIEQVYTWDVYADETIPVSEWPADETDFDIVIPDLGTQCETAGACAIQWYWWGQNKQTYVNCIDFTTV